MNAKPNITKNAPLSLKEIVFKRGSFSSPVVCSYKGGTVIFQGEGGNRHIYFLDRNIHLSEYPQYNSNVPYDAHHIWVDLHYGKDIVVHNDSCKEIDFLKEHAFKKDESFFRFKEEEFFNVLEKLIEALK